MLLTEFRINPTSFALYPVSLFTFAGPMDWRQVQGVYREAYEQAQAIHRPAITERLAPVTWN
jgi:hypothetical protein